MNKEMENTKVEETEEVIDAEVVEETEKESLITKGKNFISRNKKKILAVGLTVVGGAIGYALGSKSNGSDAIDVDYDELPTAIEDHSDSTEEEPTE